MATLPNIARMWDEHCRMPFPKEARGLEVLGVDLVLLDSLTAGCISAFVTSGGRLESEKIGVLVGLSAQLRQVAPEINGSTRSYFDSLNALAMVVLADCDENGR